MTDSALAVTDSALAVTDSAERMTIGEVAQRTGMTTSRIRYYESRGLLPEPERVAGKRRYGEDVLRRLGIIDAAQRVGFTLAEIRDLLGARGQPAPRTRPRADVARRRVPASGCRGNS